MRRAKVCQHRAPVFRSSAAISKDSVAAEQHESKIYAVQAKLSRVQDAIEAIRKGDESLMAQLGCDPNDLERLDSELYSLEADFHLLLHKSGKQRNRRLTFLN
jgi:septal ring factor EnvC (AmiA/AmiB activator)